MSYIGSIHSGKLSLIFKTMCMHIILYTLIATICPMSWTSQVKMVDNVYLASKHIENASFIVSCPTNRGIYFCYVPALTAFFWSLFWFMDLYSLVCFGSFPLEAIVWHAHTHPSISTESESVCLISLNHLDSPPHTHWTDEGLCIGRNRDLKTWDLKLNNLSLLYASRW